MSWAADVAFSDFVGQFGFDFASAHQFRRRHEAAAAGNLAGAIGDLTRRLAR